MPIAKEQLKIGFVVAANPGAYVSKDAVKTYGWEKLVDDGPDLGGDKLDAHQPAEQPATPKKAGKAAS
jgi:hypothetical protein